MDDINNGTLPEDDPLKDQPMEEESYSSWALLILTSLLIGALWTSYYLQLRKIRAIHETVISIMAGNVSSNKTKCFEIICLQVNSRLDALLNKILTKE
ncbi:hypothetical protein BDB00DRAFT_833676 [Zychaea mexicana]|uniref:uncharacterized protein n=1 Tax=Zychaea mexicana TaxID=64656 RepID=UPI0022FECD2C|nr:uncharacterized protein BDB00DRAFT_833676 [Zychaea mexicana]KAI9491254.1 hypothetical protein BDB00DRAFT_833676 [Zychaea mexicana]